MAKKVKCAVVIQLLALGLLAVSTHSAKLDLIERRSDDRIVGGVAINITEAPYQVSLQAFFHFCGGSIIGAEWILTAAHCVSGLEPNGGGVRVRVGSSRHNGDGERIDLREVIVHPNFKSLEIDWDYALLRLEVPLDFDESRSAITLPEQDEAIADGTECLVTGWGHTKNMSESNVHLRKTIVPIVNHSECVGAYQRAYHVTDRMLCAGLADGGKDACQGDSGGPMSCNGKLFGVVSWGYGCALPKYPGVYARVSAIRDWIREKTDI